MNGNPVKIIAGATLVLGLALLSACALTMPAGTLAPECTGVPGDFRTPGPAMTAGQATYGPGSSGQIEQQVAIAKPATSTAIPLLYVFDETGDYVHASTRSGVLSSAALLKADQEAYWSEVAENRFYQIPWLDKCSQASMLREPFNFRAPKGGFLFVQYIAVNCDECALLTGAIRQLITTHPDIPLRWVQVQVSGGIGHVRKE